MIAEYIRKLKWAIWILQNLNERNFAKCCKYHGGLWSLSCPHCTALGFSFTNVHRWFNIPAAPAEAYPSSCKHMFYEVEIDKNIKNFTGQYLLTKYKCFKCGYDIVRDSKIKLYLSLKDYESIQDEYSKKRMPGNLL